MRKKLRFTLIASLSLLAFTSALANSPDKLPEWNFSDFYKNPQDPAVENDLRKLKERCADFEKTYKGRIATLSGAELLAALHIYERIISDATKLEGFSQLLADKNTQDPERKIFREKMQQNLQELEKTFLFFSLEIKRLPKSRLDNLLIGTQELQKYAYWFHHEQAYQAHVLDEATEKLLVDLSLPASQAWKDLIEIMLSGIQPEIDGKKIPFSKALALLQDNDEKNRKAAYEGITQGLISISPVMAHSFNAALGYYDTITLLRKFTTPESSRHLANDISQVEVDALVKAATGRYEPIADRYYKLKAKWLKKAKLDIWDRVAPLPWKSNRKYSWEEATDLVLTAYTEFAPEIGELAKKIIENGWIDAEPNPGKRSGAYNMGLPDFHPYILMSFNGTPHDVLTLAHEVGHAIHHLLSVDNGALMYHPPLTLAETASIFGENLVFKKLLNQETDPQQKLALLTESLERMIASTLRQINFFTFERQLHEARRKGPLSAEKINALWMDAQKEIYGQTLLIPENYGVWWEYVTHFMSPFYVYSYAFAQCLVNSLFQYAQEHTDGFKDKYFALLKAGSSKPYLEVLKPFNLDPTNTEFWEKGFKVMEERLAAIEKLDADVLGFRQP